MNWYLQKTILTTSRERAAAAFAAADAEHKAVAEELNRAKAALVVDPAAPAEEAGGAEAGHANQLAVEAHALEGRRKELLLALELNKKALESVRGKRAALRKAEHERGREARLRASERTAGYTALLQRATASRRRREALLARSRLVLAQERRLLAQPGVPLEEELLTWEEPIGSTEVTRGEGVLEEGRIGSAGFSGGEAPSELAVEDEPVGPANPLAWSTAAAT